MQQQQTFHLQYQTPSPLNIPLTQSQQQLYKLAQQFTQKTNAQIQNKLKQSNWQDMYIIISKHNISNKIRIVCCSVLKWLIYHKKFVSDPIGLFKCLSEFYTNSYSEDGQLIKAQEIVEIVLQAIPSTYLKQKQKQSLIQQLLSRLLQNYQKSARILKLCEIILQTITQVQLINNQIISGQLLLFLQKIMVQQNCAPSLKIRIIKQALKMLQAIIELVNSDDEIDSNYVEEFLSTSTLAKKIIEGVIADGADGKQIIMKDAHVNAVKIIALQLYTSTWVYFADQPMFRLCLNTLLTRPRQLLDQQADILQLSLKIIQRSISQQAFYPILHNNIQPIIISLLDLLVPKQSMISLCTSDPDQFADIIYDFCMEQQRQMLEAKAGSLISSLCLYIDGYTSFLGSLCIMVIKDWNGSLKYLEGGLQYMETIQSLWKASKEEKVAVCVIVLSALSDQLDKRQDLIRPLRVQIAGMSHMFKFPQCKWPHYLICRFMFLYSFIAPPKCLDPFLPYLTVHPCFVSTLQKCYKILMRYYSKYPQLNSYIMSIAPSILLSDNLTSLLQQTINTGELTAQFQYKILQKLVLWMQQSMQRNNKAVTNKMGNLIAILIQRMKIQSYQQQQQAVFAYLSNILKKITKKQYSDSQQFAVQMMISFVKKFPSLQKQKQKQMQNNKLSIILQIGFQIVERNNGIMNNCLDLFYQICRHLPYDLVISLVQIYMGCLESQDREEDHWECYYGLEACMMRIGQLRANVPNINISVILEKIDSYSQNITKLKAFMFILSIILANTNSNNNLIQYLPPLPPPFPTIPPYQNKPYLLYYLLLLPNLSPILNQTTSYNVLQLTLFLLKNQPKIANEIKKYEDQIYCNMQSNNEVTINAYGICQRLMHPLLGKGFDVYNQFRKCWDIWPYKEEIKKVLNQSQRQQILELCTKAIVGLKVRKIIRVKHEVNEEDNTMNDAA